MVLVYRKMMSTKKIALIGAGELGSRHLQGLAKCDFEFQLQVVDPNEAALQLSKERFEAASDNSLYKKEVEYREKLSCLSSHLDFVIISTSSVPRLRILKELLESKTVSTLLLEKVLFQSLEDLENATQFLRKFNIPVYVNCPKRSYKSTQIIRNLLKDSQDFLFEVIGTNWGIGCNSIHFLDTMAFLTGSTNYELNTQNLDPKVTMSKRSGFIEFTGELFAKFPKGQLRLKSSPGDAVNFETRIESEKILLNFSESSGQFHLLHKEDGRKETLNLKSPYQSDLTQLVARDLIFKNATDLPTFEESASLHRIFLKEMIRYYNEVNDSQETYLKIT
jgi:hypothetical protein